MEKTKEITVTKMDETVGKVTVKTIFSAWDEEQVADVYRAYFVAGKETKADGSVIDTYVIPPSKAGEVYKKRMAKIFEVIVQSVEGFEGQGELLVENIKKACSVDEYRKLEKEITKVYDDATMTEEKKSTSPSSYSQPSQVEPAPTSPTNS